MEFGLFEVVPGIYQVHGFDLANVSFVKGDTGWIVIDPLTVKETSRAALKFVNEKLGERPVVVKFDNWLRSCRAPRKGQLLSNPKLRYFWTMHPPKTAHKNLRGIRGAVLRCGLSRRNATVHTTCF